MKKHKKICVVFDADGTLFDTKTGIIKAINHVLKEYGKTEILSDQENEFIGPPVKESLIKLCGFVKDDAELATKLYREVYVEQYILESKPYDGLVEMLDYLKNKGYILGIATMKTENQLQRIFEMFNCKQYFDTVQCAKGDGGLTKTMMLDQIKKKYNLSDQYYMVGDTEGDFKAAYDMKFHFIAADYGYGDIVDEQCIHIASIHELKEIDFEGNVI